MRRDVAANVGFVIARVVVRNRRRDQTIGAPDVARFTVADTPVLTSSCLKASRVCRMGQGLIPSNADVYIGEYSGIADFREFDVETPVRY